MRTEQYKKLTLTELLNIADCNSPIVAELCSRLHDMRSIVITIQSRAQDLLDDVAEITNEQG